jgi:hypothetical protein
MCGVTGTALTYPLDLLRTQTAIMEGRVEVSLMAQARAVVRASGAAGLWAGVGSAVAQKFPQFAVLFGVCDTSRTWFRENGYDTVAAGIASGVLGGVASNLTTYPLDVAIRTLQVEAGRPVGARTFVGPVEVLRAVVRQTGLRGLYAGLTPTLVKSVPACAVSYATYDALRSHLNLDRRR